MVDNLEGGTPDGYIRHPFTGKITYNMKEVLAKLIRAGSSHLPAYIEGIMIKNSLLNFAWINEIYCEALNQVSAQHSPKQENAPEPNKYFDDLSL